MAVAGEHTYHEIFSQPEAWTAALKLFRNQADSLRDFLGAGRYESIFFTGCGSSYYLALASAAFWQDIAGVSARGLPASEIWLSPGAAGITQGRALLVALSRSGETTETLRACETFRARQAGDVLALSCYPDRTLGKLSDYSLVFPAAQEQSIAQTRAFTTLYVAATASAAVWAGRDDLLAEFNELPIVARRLLGTYADLAHTLGNDTSLERFYFLGSGVRYGLACELSLKMKEMSLSHSEPFHFLEFRHGPQAMVTPATLIVGLVSESNRAAEMAVLDDMRVHGAQIVTLGERETSIAFASGISEPARNALYLPIGQLLAFERALSRDFNPDQPKHLDMFISL